MDQRFRFPSFTTQTQLTTNKPGNTSANSKHFCTFHQRKATHTSEECFRNPANAKSANAVNIPASTTTSSTTTNKPTTASTLLSNPIVRYNNLFSN
ncbi:hypothetical protein N7449_006765 [Penicillium cf. viridicatum]|uniref:Uncharacterized protein n=1 Tax=Penicillium cf. viridicatum TaxID=2972119 RepID=A0A9W9MAV7_9EURO|nr:hypothetical protein N7449_006765 [Penicillium cf. viridicatum]